MPQQELLKKVIQTLDDTGIQYMVTGSVASSLQGRVNFHKYFTERGMMIRYIQIQQNHHRKRSRRNVRAPKIQSLSERAQR